MLRDCSVCGVNHEGIQHQLLTEKELMYKKAFELEFTFESAAEGSKDINITVTQ